MYAPALPQKSEEHHACMQGTQKEISDVQVHADLTLSHLGVFGGKSRRFVFHRFLQPNEVFEELCHVVPHLDQA